MAPARPHSAGLLSRTVHLRAAHPADIWLGERLSVTAVIGGVLVLASTLLITLWEERRAAAAAATQ